MIELKHNVSCVRRTCVVISWLLYNNYCGHVLSSVELHVAQLHLRDETVAARAAVSLLDAQVSPVQTDATLDRCCLTVSQAIDDRVAQRVVAEAIASCHGVSFVTNSNVESTY